MHLKKVRQLHHRPVLHHLEVKSTSLTAFLGHQDPGTSAQILKTHHELVVWRGVQVGFQASSISSEQGWWQIPGPQEGILWKRADCFLVGIVIPKPIYSQAARDLWSNCMAFGEESWWRALGDVLWKMGQFLWRGVQDFFFRSWSWCHYKLVWWSWMARGN